MESPFHLVVRSSQPATANTVNELLERLSSVTGFHTPQEFVVIDRHNITGYALEASDNVRDSHPESEPEDFVYDNLAEGDFRLIKLSGSRTGSMQVQLVSFPLSSVPPYEALSYKWESESELRKSTILANGLRFMLSPDLLLALQRIWLWQSLVDQGSECVLYLWNDFICINQRNNNERQIQVSKMAEIYAQARRTMVWLGPGDRLSNLALLSIPGIIGELSETTSVVRKERLKEAGLENMALWRALGGFFHKSWFERLWILQEVVLAPEATLICGEVAVDWTTVTELVTLLARAGLFRLASGEHGRRDMNDKSNGLVTVVDVEKLKNIFRKTGHITSVPHIMDAAWGKQCLEPVDRVWTVVGLLPNVMRQNLFAQKFVDYSEAGRKHYEETYIKTAKWLAEIDLSGMLSMAARSKKTDKIPSWCPDWSATPRCSNLWHVLLYGWPSNN